VARQSGKPTKTLGQRGGERGQSLIELAITLPLLLLLVVGVVEVGNGLNAYMTLVDAGRDGARLGSKGSASDQDIKNLVVTEVARLPNDVDPDTDITVERDVVPGSSSIRVTVCYDHSLIMGIPLITPNPWRMCSTSTMPTLDQG
jgi:Flp pilus assembly protein TadG